MKSQAKKFDQGKPRMSLLPWRALMEVAKVATMGAKKYGAYNWLKGMQWTRLMDAGMRHDVEWLERNDTDDESGFNHLAHSIINRLFLLEYQLKNLGEDDRHGSKD